MAYVDAMNRNWTISEKQWQVVNDINGARKSFKNGESDIFLWEKFTTKPFVDNGEMRRISECPTPWPCFVIAVRNDVLENNKTALNLIVDLVQKEAKIIKSSNALLEFSERYQLKVEDVKEWFSEVCWADSQEIALKELDLIQSTLKKIGKISETKDSSLFICN